jgi:hypothetical protein
MGGSAMEKMIRMCLNRKVIGGLSVVGLGAWLVAPNLIAAVIPVLVTAVCPLSMLWMMKAMDGGHGSSRSSEAGIDDGVAPSREVRIAELQAQRDLLRQQDLGAPGGNDRHSGSADRDPRGARRSSLTTISYTPS